MQCSAMMPDDTLRTEKSVESKKVLRMSHSKIYTSQPELPPEVLMIIFDELALAAPAPYEHSPDLVLGPHSPWVEQLRFQKGLALVCKRWWEPATRILYHRIVLRRMGQISALARTLSATDAEYDFSTCIKHIGIHDCAIFEPFSDMMLEALRSILRHCPNLQSFSMMPHFNYGNGVWQWLGSSLNISWMSLESLHGIMREGPAANLRHLELRLDTDSRAAFVGLYHILSETSQLASLKLEPLYVREMPYEEVVDLSTLPTLSLPALCELQYSKRCMWFDQFAISSLQLPSLTSLTFLNYDGHSPFSFLAAHGSRLTYLHFYPQSDNPPISVFWSSYFMDLQELADVCPMIEHLVICTFRISDVLTQFHTSAKPLLHLRYLDTWARTLSRTREGAMEETELQVYDLMTGGNREKFPALGNNFRFLSHHGHADLPKICHPSALTDDDEIRTVYINDVCVVQTSWCVRPNEDFAELHMEVPESDASGEDEEQDPTFVLVESDEEDRTSWISEATSDSEPGSGGSDRESLEDACETWSESEMLSEPYSTGPRMALPEHWDTEAVDNLGLY
ncbi:hypothetical protein L226DRAFT_13802 [Lentinus tigrinus ALCF2SS1-7]|uniref:uncharacterized protein n=1 Tax=Lentinus tigrinus ALCF2SS1-7 TaxID=1328758 RepID=UPI001165D28B|nr:hypothetical protein L226DRAFT_13802 [Lentinus tigrinus ALCF2SS1-7]